MRKVMLFALMAVLMPALSPGQAYNGLYCGHTGFNVGIATTTRGYKCKPSRVTRGSGTITVTGGSDVVTVTQSGFAPIVTPSAVVPPAVQDTFCNTSGIQVVIGGQRYWFRVVTKVSDSQITVMDGGSLPAVSGTSTDWSYWNTTCLFLSSSYNATSGTYHGDQRIWASLGSATIVPDVAAPVVMWFMLSASGSLQATNGAYSWRYAAIKNYGSLGTGTEITSNGLPGVFSSPGTLATGTDTTFVNGVEFTLTKQSSNDANYSYLCFVRSEAVR